MQRIRILLDSTSQRIATNLDALVARSAVTLDKTGNRIHMTIERFLDVSYLVLRHIDYAVDRLLTELWLPASGTMTDYDGSRLSLSALSDLLFTHKDYDAARLTMLYTMQGVLRHTDYDTSRLHITLPLGAVMSHIDYDASRLRQTKLIKPVLLGEYGEFAIGNTSMALADWCYEEIT